MEDYYSFFKFDEANNPKMDYRKNCFHLPLENGLHGVVRRIKNSNTVTVEEYIDKMKQKPSRIAWVQDREDLKSISSMADLKYDPYMYMPNHGMNISTGGAWDWEAIDSKLIATDDKDVNILIIRVIPQIGMPSEAEFAKWCLEHVWRDDMTKAQAITYYYRTVRGMSFANIARCLGKSAQNVNSMFRVAQEKSMNAFDRITERVMDREED